jgi:hypothetical protein
MRGTFCILFFPFFLAFFLLNLSPFGKAPTKGHEDCGRALSHSASNFRCTIQHVEDSETMVNGLIGLQSYM